MTRKSKSFDRLVDMLDVRRRREAMRDQLAPFLEVRRAAKIHRMILNGVPADEQAIARRLFDGTAQLHAAAALGAAENRDGLLHALFKFPFRARLHINLRDFGDHDGSLLVGRSYSLSPKCPANCPGMSFCRGSGELTSLELSMMPRITRMR